MPQVLLTKNRTTWAAVLAVFAHLFMAVLAST
jgi:hypothetical protein